MFHASMETKVIILYVERVSLSTGHPDKRIDQKQSCGGLEAFYTKRSHDKTDQSPSGIWSNLLEQVQVDLLILSIPVAWWLIDFRLSVEKSRNLEIYTMFNIDPEPGVFNRTGWVGH